MSNEQKIGIVRWFQLNRHSRILYMKLDPTDTEIYKLEPGDLILAELKTIRRPRWRTVQTSTERRKDAKSDADI